MFRDWATRRTGRLLQRKLCEFVGKGPEGGRYESPLGTIDTSDDGRQMTLALRTPPEGEVLALSGYDVARKLMSLADPGDPTYLPAWGSLMAGVSVNDVTQIQIDLRRPHVLPQSLLQITLPPPPGAIGGSAGPYTRADQNDAGVHYLVNRQYQFFQAKQPKGDHRVGVRKVGQGHHGPQARRHRRRGTIVSGRRVPLEERQNGGRRPIRGTDGPCPRAKLQASLHRQSNVSSWRLVRDQPAAAGVLSSAYIDDGSMWWHYGTPGSYSYGPLNLMYGDSTLAGQLLIGHAAPAPLWPVSNGDGR